MPREAVATRTNTINLPVPHEHVAALKLSDDSILTAAQVIEAIKGGEEIHMGGEPVHVHHCPRCGAYPYLTVPA